MHKGRLKTFQTAFALFFKCYVWKIKDCRRPAALSAYFFEWASKLQTAWLRFVKRICYNARLSN